jgi:hypothetical protein
MANGCWKVKSSTRRVIDLRLPQGDCDVQALREVIDRWVAPTLAALYVEQHYTVGHQSSGMVKTDEGGVPNV